MSILNETPRHTPPRPRRAGPWAGHWSAWVHRSGALQYTPPAGRKPGRITQAQHITRQGSSPWVCGFFLHDGQTSQDSPGHQTFFRNKFPPGRFLGGNRRGCLQTNHTNAPPAEFGGPIAPHDAPPHPEPLPLGRCLRALPPASSRRSLTHTLCHSQWPKAPRFVHATAPAR